MKLAIMQPYFLPYIGYWQLLAASDVFVIYDNIEYTKKGWINRNRMLTNNEPKGFTIPLAKGSDYLNINERIISPTFNKIKLLSQTKTAYSKAPYFDQGYRILEELLMFDETNLFKFIHNSVLIIARELEIETDLIVSSTIDINHSMKSSEKVLAICKELGASMYINPIGGINLYDKNEFASFDIHLCFLRSGDIVYKQYTEPFVPSLSILDLLMFNSFDNIKQFMKDYKLV